LLEELDAGALEALRSQHLEVRVRDLEGARRALAQADYDVQVGDGALLLHEARALDAPDAVATLLVRAGAPPLRLAVEHEDLESHFLRLTEGVR
jgi:ABC-2 type transport system ATP-binding protein